MLSMPRVSTTCRRQRVLDRASRVRDSRKSCTQLPSNASIEMFGLSLKDSGCLCPPSQLAPGDESALVVHSD